MRGGGRVVVVGTRRLSVRWIVADVEEDILVGLVVVGRDVVLEEV